MTISMREQDPPAAAAKTAAAAQPDWLAGVALMTGSAASNQIGAATAALAFPVLGPAGVVAIRQWVAGALLLTAVRPRFASFTRRQWWPVLALALIFATMNLWAGGPGGRHVLGRPDGRRSAGAATGPGQVLRRLHERQPGIRLADRPVRTGPVAGPGRLACGRRYRHR
jgi:hypothetical protein